MRPWAEGCLETGSAEKDAVQLLRRHGRPGQLHPKLRPSFVMIDFMIDFIQEYQTLVGIAGALLAAVIAAKPVWRQLRSMDIQTSTLLRQHLLDRLTDAAGHRRWYAERLGSLAEVLGRYLYENEIAEDSAINLEWAHTHDQEVGRLIDSITRYREIHPMPLQLDECIDGMMAALRELRRTLDTIHRPGSMEQVDEDHAIPDAEWRTMGVASRHAGRRLPSGVDRLKDAATALDRGFDEEMTALRDTMRDLDEKLRKSAR